jgi:hypothetical protein
LLLLLPVAVSLFFKSSLLPLVLLPAAAATANNSGDSSN